MQKKAWHQITNPFDEPCHIIEIQYGEKAEENDIEDSDTMTQKIDAKGSFVLNQLCFCIELFMRLNQEM